MREQCSVKQRKRLKLPGEYLGKSIMGVRGHSPGDIAIGLHRTCMTGVMISDFWHLSNFIAEASLPTKSYKNY
jgi:hypothetical protein